jgi:hypothetical protein
MKDNTISLIWLAISLLLSASVPHLWPEPTPEPRVIRITLTPEQICSVLPDFLADPDLKQPPQETSHAQDRLDQAQANLIKLEIYMQFHQSTSSIQAGLTRLTPHLAPMGSGTLKYWMEYMDGDTEFIE